MCHMQICHNYFGHTSLVKINNISVPDVFYNLKQDANGCNRVMILNGYVYCLTQVEEDFL